MPGSNSRPNVSEGYMVASEPPGRQSGGKMSKLGGIIGCKFKTSSWHLNGFSDGGNIGSTVHCRGEAHRYAVDLH